METTPTCQSAVHRGSFRSQTYLLVTLLSFALAGNAAAQSTNIAIGSTTIQPSVKRLGINLGTLNFYDSGQTTQNLLNQNPGFESQIWNSTIRCISGTATSCVDDDQWSGWPAGFWNGATFEVFYGAAAGRNGTVTSSTAPGGGQGVTLNFNNYGVAPGSGDYVIVRKTVPGGAAGGWWPSTSGAGKIGDNLTDLPPGTLGKQTVVVTAPSSSDSASIAGFFDSVIGKTFLQLNGTYQLQFKAKGVSGSNQIKLLISRNGVATYVNQTVTLTNSWNDYSMKFTAAETGSAIGIGGVTFSTVGSDSFELDDVSLVKLNGDPTNTTAFRDPVVNALRTLQPGVIRYWGGQLGDTLDNLITPAFGRQRAGYLAWWTEVDNIDYGLHDFLALCQLVGAEPWFVVPTTFSTSDASNLIEYLAGSSGTNYGSKRAALGQSAPWTQVFPKIHLEFGNEAWNGTFKGGSIEYAGPYASRAQTIFASMRANGSYSGSSFDLVLGGQAAYPGRNTEIQNLCNNNDSFDVAPYTMNQVDSYTDNESLYGSTFAEPEAFMSSSGSAEGLSPGMVYQDYQAIQASKHPVPLSFYEVNLSTLDGAISQQALDTYTPSLGAGLMVADTMLLSLRQFGVVNQELFALPQYNFKRSDGKNVLLWGSVVDMGVTDRKRPQFLALQLANQALSNGASMLQTQHTGANPTWNQAMVNSVQFNGAHYLQSFAFANGTGRSAIVFNLSRSSSLPITFSGANAPSGTVQMQQLTSAYPTDTNENANVVNITYSTLSGFNAGSGLSLPPYSMTVLLWGGTNVSTPAPAVTAVTSIGVSATSAVITWITDQPSSSQVLYGTGTGYGSSSSLNAALTTVHSVTLTGLTAGTTYNYSVSSTNASGSTANSTNTTFTTIGNAVAGTSGSSSSSSTGSSSSSGSAPTAAASNSPAPQVSYVESWGITESSITVSWSTNEPATTSLAYGTTPALGQVSPVQSSLSNTHGVTLTGLNSNTTYYFVAQSAGSLGSIGYSTVASATTAKSAADSASVSAAPTTGPPPQISYVLFWGVTDSTATISWSTNVPSTTALGYGTSVGLGQATPTQTALTSSHGVTLTGLTSGTTYYFVAQSADSTGNIGYSTTYSFTTANNGVVSTSTSSSSTVSALTGVTPSVANGNSGPAPQISFLASWGITGSGITVSWATDVLANTTVAYGTTKDLGQFTPLQPALTNNHGVTITGLSPATNYYFAAQSTSASGSIATSPIYTFTTLNGGPPTISAITVVPGRNNSAQISWATSAPTNSYVQFGTSTNYDRWSTLTDLTASPNPAMGWVPSGLIHYQLVSTDAYGNQAVSPDYTFLEP